MTDTVVNACNIALGEEGAAINAGIAADPDAPELTFDVIAPRWKPLAPEKRRARRVATKPLIRLPYPSFNSWLSTFELSTPR